MIEKKVSQVRTSTLKSAIGKTAFRWWKNNYIQSAMPSGLELNPKGIKNVIKRLNKPEIAELVPDFEKAIRGGGNVDCGDGLIVEVNVLKSEGHYAATDNDTIEDAFDGRTLALLAYTVAILKVLDLWDYTTEKPTESAKRTTRKRTSKKS